MSPRGVAQSSESGTRIEQKIVASVVETKDQDEEWADRLVCDLIRHLFAFLVEVESGTEWAESQAPFPSHPHHPMRTCLRRWLRRHNSAVVRLFFPPLFPLRASPIRHSTNIHGYINRSNRLGFRVSTWSSSEHPMHVTWPSNVYRRFPIKVNSESSVHCLFKYRMTVTWPTSTYCRPQAVPKENSMISPWN